MAGTCQNTEAKRLREWHSLTGDGRLRNLSGKVKKVTEGDVLTSWRRQKEGLVRTRKESNRGRGTCQLETAEGWTCQNTEIKRADKGCSPAGDGRGRDLSEHVKKAAEREALTSWRQQGGLVRIWKERDRTRGTHFLETAEGETSEHGK